MFYRSLACVLGLMAFASLDYAGSFSFTGTFGSDDQLQDLIFTLTGTSTVTAVTYGYAGGTNQAAMIIPEGGFDPWLAIFDSSGNLLDSVDNGACGQVPADSMTGSCFDSFIQDTFNAGTYTLVLSESDNQPVSNLFSDGYTRTGQGDFTGSEFGCGNGSFCDVNGTNRTGNWAVDVLNADNAVLAPEPAATLLAAGGLAGLFLLRKRIARR